MNTRQKLTLGIAAIFMVTLTIVGVTYAYFVTRVEGDAVQQSVNVQTATVGDIVYKDINGPVDFSNTQPGTTKYYHFSVANLGDQQQPFELFLTEARAKEGYTAPTITVAEQNYTQGEFIHTTSGTDDAACYGNNVKMSAEIITDQEAEGYAADQTYKTTCFGGTTYNNFKITLYELAQTTATDTTQPGDTLKSFTSDESVFGYENLTGASNKNVVEKINYAAETGLLTRVDIEGHKVHNYVLVVEYIDNDLVQNAENLASLKLQVDIRA